MANALLYYLFINCVDNMYTQIYNNIVSELNNKNYDNTCVNLFSHYLIYKIQILARIHRFSYYVYLQI